MTQCVTPPAGSRRASEPDTRDLLDAIADDLLRPPGRHLRLTRAVLLALAESP